MVRRSSEGFRIAAGRQGALLRLAAMAVLSASPLAATAGEKGDGKMGKARKAAYVPAPRPAKTDYLIGAHYFPGWKEGTHYGWGKIEPYPERTPLLGYYDEGSPEVADWEIKWALEHGIRFFLYCWYGKDSRTSGAAWWKKTPVTDGMHYYGHALHEGLFKSRYGSRMKFAIMWENANAGGVSSRRKMLEKLLPYWIRTYFRRDNYLKVDGKPMLYVYDVGRFVRDLGGKAAVKALIPEMRKACRKAGLAGLLVLGENRGGSLGDVIPACGYDGVFSYCWHTPQRRPTGKQAIACQLGQMRRRLRWPIDFLPTASVGWDPMPWQSKGSGAPWLNPDKMTRWKLTPRQWQSLLEKTKGLMDGLPKDRLARRVLLLDNWNEWGEGHYLAPHGKEPFAYLQAVRKVFTDGANRPDYRTPKELHLGPYDTLYRKSKAK